ncbi:TIGR03086 family metal-binding protein [Modestobacter lapidis]|nr:TIGR03086 family protein [Modestobacter lapidis]
MSDISRAELLERYQRAQAQFTDRVDAVAPGQWHAPALPGWTVADLIAHVTADQLAVPQLLAGGTPDIRARTSPDELLGDDPLTAWETAADDALTAWAGDGALDGAVELPDGPAPAAHHLRSTTAALTVHAYDLAAAVGGDTDLDRELVADALQFAEEHLGDDGVPGLVDPPAVVPPGAELLTRLLARYGRRV